MARKGTALGKGTPADQLVEATADLAGATGGTAIGLALGTGDPRALAAAAATAALTSVFQDIGARLLGRRERIRVGEATKFAYQAIQELVTAGESPRDDGWFKERPGRRSIAAEICEGTLLNAQKEHEERKVEYYGYLVANLGFVANIDESLANWLLVQSDQLTWTQLVLLAMIGGKDRFELPDIVIGEASGDWTPWGLHQQLADLGYARREFILGAADPIEPGATGYRIPRLNLQLREMKLRGAGNLLYRLMWLDRIPHADIELVIQRLHPSKSAP